MKTKFSSFARSFLCAGLLGAFPPAGAGTPSHSVEATVPEAPPDSIEWLPVGRVRGQSINPLGGSTRLPDGWRVQVRVWSAAESRTFVMALTNAPADLPSRLPRSLISRLSSPDPRGPKSPLAAEALLDTLGMRFFRLRAVKPKKPSMDSRGRRLLHAWTVLDSAQVSPDSSWLTIFDASGSSIHGVRLEAR